MWHFYVASLRDMLHFIEYIVREECLEKNLAHTGHIERQAGVRVGGKNRCNYLMSLRT